MFKREQGSEIKVHHCITPARKSVKRFLQSSKDSKIQVYQIANLDPQSTRFSNQDGLRDKIYRVQHSQYLCEFWKTLTSAIRKLDWPAIN